MSFYSFAPSAPNEYEVFFYSLLLCMNAPLVKELDEWVGEVLLQRSSALEHKARRLGCLKAPSKKNNVSVLFDPMISALCLRDRVSHRNPISRKVLRLGD